MTHAKSLKLSLWAPEMLAVLVAQFLSALADNAILIIAIAIVKKQGQSNLVPLLQAAFVVPFIVLAPFVGQIADGLPKGRVMLWANLLKLFGAAVMALGVNPLIAYNLIGAGATVYSPAKYGILSQMFRPDLLVRANGLLEGSTIAAILLGVLLGGWLADHSLSWAYSGVILAYVCAALANLMIPRLPAESPGKSFSPLPLIDHFFAAFRKLLADPDARFSLIGTSLFWGSGTTLRLLLFAWVPVALSITDNQTPANLMGVVSVGIVFGAAAAGAWVSLKTVNRALLGGLLLGPMILAMVLVSDVENAALLMAGTGFCGGLFIVPLNALLQERGHVTVGAGHALAVQNFFENIVMLVFVGGYFLTTAHELSVFQTLTIFGGVLMTATAALSVVRMRQN